MGTFTTDPDTVSLRAPHLGAAMLDIVQLQVQLIRVAVLPAEFASIVGEHRLDRQAFGSVEGQHVIVQHSGCGFWLFGSMQKAKRQAAIGIHHRVQVDFADPFDVTHKEGVLAQQLTRSTTLHVPLFEGWIVLL